MGWSDAFKSGTNFVRDTGRRAVDTVKDAGSAAVDTVKDAGSAAVDTVKDAGGAAVDTVKSAGSAAVSTVKKGGGAVVNGVKNAGAATVDTVKDAGGAAVDTVKSAGEDVVELSGEAAGAVAEQAGNYYGGIADWGKNNWNTAKDIVDNPRNAVRGIDSIARFNPVYGIPAAAAEGKNPAEWLGDNYRTGTGIRDNVVQEYRTVRDERGYAGVAGYIAPEVAIAAVTAGTSSAAKTGGGAVAREFAGEVAPGPDDALVRGKDGDQNDRRWWEGALDVVA